VAQGGGSWQKFPGFALAGSESGSGILLSGVGDQTTMLRHRDGGIQRPVAARPMVDRYGEAEIERHYRMFEHDLWRHAGTAGRVDSSAAGAART